MKTKYVCHDLISLYVNLHNNRTMSSTNLLVKICRWGGGGEGKRAVSLTGAILLRYLFSPITKNH